MDLATFYGIACAIFGVLIFAMACGWVACEEKLHKERMFSKYMTGFSNFVSKKVKEKDEEIKRLRFQLLQYELSSEKEDAK